MAQVIFDPHPRTSELIFKTGDWQEFSDRYQLQKPESINDPAFYWRHIEQTRYIVGQPPLDKELLEKAVNLKAIFNVESNFLDNMDYDYCFEKGIHVLSTSPVFARPVAELGLGMALSLLRDIAFADNAFKAGSEVYGLESNGHASLLSGSRVGFIGYGDLGVSLHSLLAPFRCAVSVYDPWLPGALITANGATATDIDSVLSDSDVIFIVAATTDTNAGCLGAVEFDKMQRGTCVILLSRAGVVDFPAMTDAVEAGHIRVATDVFPEEPVPKNDTIRALPGFLLSAHRAGALDSAFKEMGSIVLGDMKLLDQGLVPRLCKRAERETVMRFRSKPVEIN